MKSTRKTRREIYSRRQRSIEHSGTPVYLFPWENNVSYRTYAFFACFSLFIGEKQVLFFEFWILIFALTKSKTTRYLYSLPLHSAPPFSFAIFFFLLSDFSFFSILGNRVENELWFFFSKIKETDDLFSKRIQTVMSPGRGSLQCNLYTNTSASLRFLRRETPRFFFSLKKILLLLSSDQRFLFALLSSSLFFSLLLSYEIKRKIQRKEKKKKKREREREKEEVTERKQGARVLKRPFPKREREREA